MIGVVDPGAERASVVSQNRKVAVVGTEATIGSHAYLRALEMRGLEAREKACPLLVPLVEEGWVEHPVTEQVAEIYLREAFADGFHDADVLVLGCTHYPLIQPLLRRVAPPHVSIVDSAHSTAKVVAERIRAQKGKRESNTQPTGLQFFATDSVEKFRRLGPRFLGHPVESVEHVDLKE